MITASSANLLMVACRTACTCIQGFSQESVRDVSTNSDSKVKGTAELERRHGLTGGIRGLQVRAILSGHGQCWRVERWVDCSVLHLLTCAASRGASCSASWAASCLMAAAVVGARPILARHPVLV
jgi:hypothetical protein